MRGEEDGCCLWVVKVSTAVQDRLLNSIRFWNVFPSNGTWSQ